ncbi:uncharacterized protein LOC144119964 [Amblyomma americanum]
MVRCSSPSRNSPLSVVQDFRQPRQAMAVSTSAARKTLHSGAPSTAPPGKFKPELAGDGGQQLRRRRVADAESPVSPANASPGGIASPANASPGGVASPANASPRGVASPEGSVSPAISPSVTPTGACSPSGVVTPTGARSPSGAASPGTPSPPPELADELAEEAEQQPVVRVVRQKKPRSSAFDFCIFLVSSAIILIFIALLLFVLAFDNEIVTVIDKGIQKKPKLRDLYCDTKLCKSFTREVISFVNFSRDPCNELLEYVCEGYEKEMSIEHLKWAKPGMDYARFTKVLDGIYKRNVSDGPVWDRKFVAEDLWELTSPLYERCIAGDAAPAPLPYNLTEYLRDRQYNFTAAIVEAYKMIPVFHHIFTSAYPWKHEHRTSASMVLGRERSLMPPEFASTRSAAIYAIDFIKDVLRGISPELRISEGLALSLGEAEQLLGLGSIPLELVEPCNLTQVHYAMNDSIREQIAAFADFISMYDDSEGKIRIMYDAVLSYAATFNNLHASTRYDTLRVHMWLHLAARIALATGIEPAATAVLVLMGGILGKAHAERRCLTLFDTEVRPFAFDRVRAMLHTDDAAARGRELYAKFIEYSKLFMRNASFASPELQEFMIRRIDELRLLFMYPFSNMTDDEVGQYPLTRLVYQPIPVPQNATFWEHLYLIKKEIWDKGMQDHRSAHNLTWIHFSTLEHQPRFSMYLRALYVPAIFYQRIWAMTDPNETEAIPLDLPIFWWPILHQLTGMMAEGISTSTLTGGAGQSMGFRFDRVWAGSQACHVSMLHGLGYAPLTSDAWHAPSEPFLLEFLYNLFMSKTESWKMKDKPTAEQVFLHDYPDITIDKLFVIAIGSNFCRKDDDDIKQFRRERTNAGMTAKQRLTYLMRYWPKFRKIFNCSDTDVYSREPTIRCISAVGAPPGWM